MLIITWWLGNADTEPSYNFCHKMYFKQKDVSFIPDIKIQRKLMWGSATILEIPLCEICRAEQKSASYCDLCMRLCTEIDLNSLAPGGPGCHFKTAIFNLVLLIGNFTSSKDSALRWMPRKLIDDKSTLVQAMAWCREAASHCLSHCWPSSMSPYGVTRPKLVKSKVVVEGSAQI